MNTTHDNATNATATNDSRKDGWTPGPWRVGDKRRIEALHNDKGGCLLIASERAIEGRTHDEAVANARFVVRACNAHNELVDALRGMLEWARRVKAANPGMEVGRARALLSRINEDAM